MGGRLDAVNVVDADVAVVVSIGVDHAEFLGSTEELIGFEKAGIFRAGRPAICGMPQPPDSLVRHARSIDARLLVRGRDFDGIDNGDGSWNFVVAGRRYARRPAAAQPGGPCAGRERRDGIDGARRR